MFQSWNSTNQKKRVADEFRFENLRFYICYITGYGALSSNAHAAKRRWSGRKSDCDCFNSYDTRWKNEPIDLDAILSLRLKITKDLANVLSIEHIENIQAAISYHRQTSTNQIAVLTIPSLKSRSLEGLSLSVARAWG